MALSPGGTSLAVGLDIGNSKCVVAVSTDGVVDAVLNQESKRETPTVVHLANNHRLFGSYAASLASTNPTSTITQLKRLIGLPLDETKSKAERLLLPYETSEDADGGISVKVLSGYVTAVETLAMLVSHLKRTAEMTTAATMPACVIGVPAYFTSQQKNAYWDAALIAGWNPLGLLHEGVATALEYAADRSDVDAPSVVAFVDIGHCDTQVTVVRFQGKVMRVLGEDWDANLGGRDFDEVLFQHFMGVFEKQYRRDIRTNVKACVRLRTACEKAKRVLSANKEADVSIDYLMEGVEYASGLITRDQFEELSKSLLDRIGVVFGKALAKAKVVANEIDSVELVGSGSRIPSISRILTGIFRRGLSRTLNGSECIARGCARLHEMLMIPSPASKIANVDAKEIDSLELVGSGFQISAIWTILTGIFQWGLGRIHNGSECLARRCAPLREMLMIPSAAANPSDIDPPPFEQNKESWINNNVFTFGNKKAVDLSSSTKREADLLKQDKSYEEAKNRRNDLESRIYQVRKEVEGHRTITAESKDTISRKLEEMEQRLYENGDGLSQDDYAARMEELEVILRNTTPLSSDVFETKVSEEMSNLKLASAMSASKPTDGSSSSAQEVRRLGRKRKETEEGISPINERKVAQKRRV